MKGLPKNKLTWGHKNPNPDGDIYISNSLSLQLFLKISNNNNNPINYYNKTILIRDYIGLIEGKPY